ncbi:MAG: hypothetical protein ACREIP_20590, partial [Alphaproteobacteria bacterium]
MERLATLSRRASAEPLQIEPLAHPVDALAFVNDPVTAEVLAALFGATGQGRVQFGGLNAAIQVLQSAPCPQLLVIDISGLNDPVGHLDRLADLCPEGTGVVLVGSGQDDSLATELRAMGIAHYLGKPVEAEQMRSAILQAAGSFAATVPGSKAMPAPDRAELASFAALNEELAAPPQQSEFGLVSAQDAAFPSIADPLPYSRPAPPQGPAPELPPSSSAFVPTSTGFAPMASATAPPSDPFSAPVHTGPGIPPPATTQMGPISVASYT